jgi:hypothetical protein
MAGPGNPQQIVTVMASALYRAVFCSICPIELLEKRPVQQISALPGFKEVSLLAK